MSSRNLVVVEGSSDKFVVQNLLSKNGIACEAPPQGSKAHNEQAIVVQSQDGRENLLNSLDSLLDSSELECLGIVIDADDESALRKSWKSLNNTLSLRGITLPDEPVNSFNSTATISFRRIPIGIWIMSGEALRGELEDFFSTLIPDQDALWLRANSVVKEIPLVERRFKKESKARVHTWLAWQEVPGETMGLAIKCGDVRHDSATALSFLGWVRALFNV